jgi:hypothetical protein
MHDEQETFTITLIADGDDSKLLLSTSETPAKEDSEASGVIYKQDLPDQFDEIISKIPRFSEAIAEDGSEETITHTVDEFIDLYDLDLIDLIERGEELLGHDLDNDNEEDEDHKPGDADPYDIYRNDSDALSHIDPREALHSRKEDDFDDWESSSNFENY